MALMSMTGFGDGQAAAGGIEVFVELSSVNRKQLDVNISLPRNLVTLDAQVQKMVRATFSRGRISGIVRVEVTGKKASEVHVDHALAAGYLKVLRAEAKQLGLEDHLDADMLLRIPGLIVLQSGELNAEQVGSVLDKALGKALRALTAMRKAEGKALETDVRERLKELGRLNKDIEKLAPKSALHYRERLQSRLAEAGINGLVEDERVAKEIALFADRSDISEETTRLKSHLKQAGALLRSADPVGRTLDFLCQELFREINTIGSKANFVEITQLVVQFKTELERIREQVQNVE